MRLYIRLAAIGALCEVLFRNSTDFPLFSEVMMPVRRRIEFDDQVWHALQHLCLETGKGLQEVADEAFRDLLRKRRRPVTLRDGLRESLRMIPANEQPKATIYRLRPRG